jgi:hypothetical protein
MKIAKFWPIAVVAAAITLGVLRYARAAVTFNGDVPLPPTLHNPCNGEIVDISGVLHEVIDKTVSDSGNIHLSVHFNAQGVSGVGETTGANYSFSDSVNEHLTFAGASNETISHTLHVVGQGGVPNFDFHFLVHFTVNADGTVTSSFDNFTTTCH